MAKTGADAFRRMLAHSHEVAARLDVPGFPLAALEGLQAWQRDRFRNTYADFLARTTDAPACHFFLDELYGGLDFRERDHEVGRVAPVMTRLLPQHALESLADAFRLQALSLELDIAMVETGPTLDFRALTVADYARCYRACGQRERREIQIELIRELGHELERLVDAPLLLRLITMLRGPAIAAGFGRLQAFLEEGLKSFRMLADPGGFVDAIYRREWLAMTRLFAGDADPYAGLVTK